MSQYQSEPSVAPVQITTYRRLRRDRRRGISTAHAEQPLLYSDFFNGETSRRHG